MTNLDSIINKIPMAEMTDKVIIKNQSTGDIIKEIIKSHDHYGYQGVYLKDFFKGDTKKVINDIYTFMQNELIYEIEPDDYQTSRSPLRILHDNYNNVGIDCKNYSLLAAAILKNKGIPYFFRFVSYQPGRNVHHVYVMAYDGTRWVHIDPLQERPYNLEKNVIFVKDIKPKNMMVRMAGIGQTTFQQAALKPILWTGRTAFLQAVRKNIANVGGKLVTGYNKAGGQDKVLNWWAGLGGSKSSLIKALNKVPTAAVQRTGIKPPDVFLKNPLRPNPARAEFCRAKYPATISINRGACTRGIIRGIGDPQTAAIITAAAAVITSMTQMLAQLGVGTGSTEDYTKYVTDTEAPPNGNGVTMAGLPWPILLIAGGLAINYLFFSKKKPARRKK